MPPFVGGVRAALAKSSAFFRRSAKRYRGHRRRVSAMEHIVGPIIACPDCATVLELPPLGPRAVAVCPTCDHHLERSRGRSSHAALCFALATCILLIPADVAPLLRVSVAGVARVSTLGAGIVILWQNQWIVLALLVFAFAVALPLVRFTLLTLVLGALHLGHRPACLARGFRYAITLDAWAMTDVFLLGGLVGYSRVAAQVPVHIEVGGICLMLASACAMLSRATLDRRSIWRSLAPQSMPASKDEALISCPCCDLVVPARREGSRCPRCSAPLRARKPSSSRRTLALLVTGLVLYVSANVFPMSTDTQLGTHSRHRIIDGIGELFQADLWPLGVLIFITSIAIPLLKLLGLGWLLGSVHRRSDRLLIGKTKLYRVIQEIGRWSSVDVFTIVVFLPLLTFGPLASAHAGLGATAFLLVVASTMLAASTFDPRDLWDARSTR